MDKIHEKIQTNTKLIKQLTDENESLLKQLNVSERQAEKGITFKVVNLQEFIEKFKLMFYRQIARGYFLIFRDSNGDHTIHYSDIHGMQMPESYRSGLAISEIGQYKQNGEYRNVDEIELFIKLDDKKLILYNKYIYDEKQKRQRKQNNSDIGLDYFDIFYNTLQQTIDNPDIYVCEIKSATPRLNICPYYENKADKCDCYTISVKQCLEAEKKFNIWSGNLELREEIINNTIKCTHKCACSNGLYPYQCWRPKLKYTINIATREIHLYMEFE